MKKVLLLLGGGLALGLTHDPRIFFRIQHGMIREWREINQRALREAIKKLYQSKLVDLKEKENGDIFLVLSENGKKKYLEYNLDTIKVKNPSKWDKMWRVIVFDIPEFKKKGRDALVLKLKQMGFYPMQKSVFIHPFPCKDEVDFISEIFELKPYVRFMLVKEIDIDLHLKNIFNR